VARDIEDVGADERFSPRDYEETALVDLSNLIDECVAFFGREFVVPAGRFRRRVEITMVALKIAALREVQGDEIRFEVVDGSAIVWRKIRGWRSKELRYLLLDISERARKRWTIEDWKRFAHARILQL
jgi:hypothetical protein